MSDDLDWKSDGLCVDVNPALFYPGRGEPTAEAKAICAACPVEARCLEYALEHSERFGIWGGTSEAERRKLRRVNPQPRRSPMLVSA